MQRQAHSLLALATIAFSKSGLDGNHTDFVKDEPSSMYKAIDYLIRVGEPSQEDAGNIALYVQMDIERRMLSLARELDELSVKYTALDEKLS